MSALYPVIMAGGVGSRLWPYSRRSLPKQLRAFVGERTMLQATLDRLLAVAAAERVYVITNAEHVAATRAQLPEVPPEQIVGEPEGRGTAPAVALGAAMVMARDPDGVLACFPADHVIRPDTAFRDTVLIAARAAAEGLVVVIGVPPASADTGYGYIELGPPAASREWHAVAAFREKPDRETAQRYLGAGQHLWNAGMFVWSAATVFEEYQAHLPRLAAQMAELTDAARAGVLAERLPAIWAGVSDVTTVDYGIMERTSRAACVRATFAWSDVGSWDALGDVISPDGAGNVTRGRVVGHDAGDCIVFAPSGRAVALIGVRDLVVVDTDDCVLVCARDRAQDVRALVNELKTSGPDLL